ncbi:MAG: hypothetical protein SGBAC_010363, partial [Bacillariaceae sp.]
MGSAIYTGTRRKEEDDVPKDIRHFTVAPQIQAVIPKAFQNCNLLVSVSLPLDLKVIGESAFEYCSSLKTISIPSSVNTIHSSAFRKCEGLETMDLPEGLTKIADQTFEGCKSLQDVHISSTVLEIGTQAFGLCSALPYVDLPNGLSQIRPAAFVCCFSLERILIPSTVVTIGSNAFMLCRGLKSVEISISENGTSSNGEPLSIEYHAFYNCSKLRNIAIPSNSNLEPNAFRACHDRYFEMYYENGGRLMDQLPELLKGRFKGLPFHKVCYQQAHATGGTPMVVTPIVNDNTTEDGSAYDFFGLTPFHILALSTRPSVVVLQKLVGATCMPTDGLLAFDGWDESTPLRYAIENHTPGALAFIKAMLHALVNQRAKALGLERWQSDVLVAINLFEGSDTSKREEWINDVFAL